MHINIEGFILFVIILVFLFWDNDQHVDNWDRINYVVDTHYQQMMDSRINSLGCITDTECEQYE